MKELSLNILDIAENSVKAGATLTEITVDENGSTLSITIKDNGSGMPAQTLAAVTDPFYTTRTTRSVGLGIPLIKMSAEQTGGYLELKSKVADDADATHGTELFALYYKNHIDFTPPGDVISTVTTLIQGHPDVDFTFVHRTEYGEVRLETAALREVLGEVSLASYEVIKWITEYLREQYDEI